MEHSCLFVNTNSVFVPINRILWWLRVMASGTMEFNQHCHRLAHPIDREQVASPSAPLRGPIAPFDCTNYYCFDWQLARSFHERMSQMSVLMATACSTLHSIQEKMNFTSFNCKYSAPNSQEVVQIVGRRTIWL